MCASPEKPFWPLPGPVTRRAWLAAAGWLCSGLLMAPALAAMPELRIGVEPYISPRSLIAGYLPLRQALERNLGRPVMLFTGADYRQFLRRVEAADFDLLLLSPHAARFAETSGGYQAVAQSAARSSGLLLVRKESPIRRIEELRGSTIAMPDPLTAATLLGESLLRESGLMTANAVTLRYYTVHNTAALMVLRGGVQACVINNTAFSQMPADIRQHLRVLAETPTIAHASLLVRMGLTPAEQKRQVDAVMLFVNSTQNGRSILAKYGLHGLEPLSNADQARLEPMEKELSRRLTKGL
ncbi:phosphate/phosphite/phosphonate ABC transporter substrate-binding protein [Parachitinimonas caeni]|uniref:Phosphate/phosphite/phosphonate ABC transporter substrate-binding protein n=1 Tax=Parachitinimonas caeni TaxID=3031301 RepID=A0ABT7DR04_9NEIS|nr:phosphate/phosphite/phosphonate ABC transporter substrate-binding protein [Parachitinimonas caeni]MDK2122503.1 phosphate/phosphite/phosphonate ABC transporter substrate-binding protein [Parachitinimonas caeni]